MKKIFYVMFVMGFVFLLNGCDKPLATEPQSAPASETAPARYRITYQWTMLSNDSVGNDWTHTVTCDGAPINNGDTVTAKSGSTVTIRGTVTENDKYADTGSGTVILALADGASGAVRITVCEGHGQYAGNTAEWELTCRAAREE